MYTQCGQSAVHGQVIGMCESEGIMYNNNSPFLTFLVWNWYGDVSRYQSRNVCIYINVHRQMMRVGVWAFCACVHGYVCVRMCQMQALVSTAFNGQCNLIDPFSLKYTGRDTVGNHLASPRMLMEKNKCFLLQITKKNNLNRNISVTSGHFKPVYTHRSVRRNLHNYL